MRDGDAKKGKGEFEEAIEWRGRAGKGPGWEKVAKEQCDIS